MRSLSTRRGLRTSNSLRTNRKQKDKKLATSHVSGLEQLERRQMLASAAVAGGLAGLSAEATYVQPGKFIYKAGGFLSKPSKASALDITMNYLKANAGAFGLQPADVASSIVSDMYTDADSGITHVYLRQVYNGLEITNTDMSIAVMRDGRILSAGGTFVPGIGSAAPRAIRPTLNATAALKKAASNLGLTLTQEPVLVSAARGTGQVQAFSAPQISTDVIPAQLHYAATSAGVALSWDFVLNVPGGQHWYDTNVAAANGSMLFTNDWVDTFADPNVVGTKAENPNATYPIVWPSTGAVGTTPGNLLPPTYTAAYNVYARPNQSPSTGGRTSQVDPWDLAASPNGWQDEDGDTGGEQNTTRGNNVYAQDDANGNNGTDGSTPSGGALAGDGSGSLNFDFPLDLAQAPSVYRSAAVTNLYYWNNIIHDIHFKYGFTEAARNFQRVNYSGLGAGNDFVWGDAQDGSGTNNANFSTPADGSSGRMQMFIFTAPTPDRDGDLDAQVIIHEYGHGVSNRLSGNGGGLAATQSGGMGEGWGDWWGLMLLQTDGSVAAQNAAYPVGTYVLAQPLNGAGIRRQPYSYNMSINNQTLGTYNSSSEVHDAGELWCDVLWDMNWNLIRKYGFNSNVAQGFGPGDNPAGQGNLLALRLVMDALKLQPISPTFLQARDAILAADTALTGGANAKEIWRAFARRGWGVNATTASANSTSVVENFDVPPALFDPFVTNSSPNGGFVDPNFSTIKFTFDEAMNPASFDVASDVVSFTGPGGANAKPQITGFTWSNGNKSLNINFTTQVNIGSYAMTIGPNILAADDGHAMDQNVDGSIAQPDDTYTASMNLTDRFPGPDGGGYEASPVAFQNLDLVIGQAGVTTLVNGTDDGNAVLTLPGGNTFRYYGTNYTSMSVSANGHIGFGGTASTSVANSDLTSSPTLASICVAWDDWRTDLNGLGGTDSAVLWKIVGNDLIVEWSDVPNFNFASGSGGTGTTFQAILHLNTGTGNGDVIVNYPDLNTGSGSYDSAASASVGIKAAGAQGANRLLISQDKGDNAFVQTGTAMRFTCTAATGTIFADNNGNGVQDGGESPVAGAFVYNDANNNNAFDPASEMSATTDGSGNYKLTSLFDGPSLVVRSQVGATWIETQPTPTTFAVAQGLTATSQNIGVFNTTITGTGAGDAYLVRQNGAQDRVEISIGGNLTYTILKSVLPTLTFNGGAGTDSLVIDFVNGDPLSAFNSRIKFTGTGSDTLAATGSGTFNVDPAQSTDTPTLALYSSGGATMNLSNGLRLTAITLSNGDLNVAAGSASPLIVSSLSVAGTGTLDLNDNDMILFYGGPGISPLATIAGLIRTARNGGAWDGDGITSTEAANRPAHDTTLGAVDAADYKSVYGANASFDGEPLSGLDAVLVKYTYYGDTDFNGKVDGADYARVDAQFNQQGVSGDIGGWFNGDFDYNDKIDGGDYALIDAAFNSQLGVL